MSKALISGIVSALLAVAFSGNACAARMSLSSPDIKNHGTIAMEYVYKGFGCTGDDVSPALTWKNASAAFIGFNIHFHTLAKAGFIGRYGRE